MPKNRGSVVWKLVFASLLILLLTSILGNRIYCYVLYDRDCSQHIKRAGDANTVELATQEMKVVLGYLEAHNMQSGYTSVLYNTPDEDVGYWYQNLRASLDELTKVQPGASQLEKTNLLMKLRQTLLDHAQSGESVTEPSGISIFPDNIVHSWILVFSILLFIFTVFIFRND